MKKIANYFDKIPTNIQPAKLVEKRIIQNVLTTKRIDVKDYNQEGVNAGIRAIAPATVDFTDKLQNDTFFQQCHLFSATLQAEQPLLLHPVLDNPDDCLRFEKNGTVTPKNEKGRISIEIYGLNDIEKRQDLIAARKKIVDKVKAEVNHCICNYRDDERLFQDLLRIREKLRLQAAGSQDNNPYNEPFSAVRRACVMCFETFFIDTFKQSDKYSQEDKDRLERVFKELEHFLREFDEYPL